MHLLLHIPTKSPRKSKKRPHFLLHNSPGRDPNSLEKKNPTMLLCNSSFYKSNKNNFHTRTDFKNWVVKSTKFTFLSRPSFAHHISHSLSTFTLLFLFSCWYMHNKTCSKCETNQTDYKNTDTEVAKANPTSSKSFSELGNIF